MGVSCSYHFPQELDVEVALYALIKAAGLEPPLCDGEQNIFMGTHYLRCPTMKKDGEQRPIAVGFYDVELYDGELLRHVYLHNASSSRYPRGWYFSTNSRPGALAVFRKLADAFGGLVIFTDFDDKGQMWGIPEEGLGFVAASKLAYAMMPAVITSEDRKLAAYD